MKQAHLIFGHVTGQPDLTNIKSVQTESKFFQVVFVCVEVLQPSQPNGVMSSVVSLPNHTFTGQA